MKKTGKYAWTETQDRELFSLYKRQSTITEIVETLGRDRKVITNRLHKLKMTGLKP